MKKLLFSTVVLCLIIFGWVIARPYRIHGDCMEPTITDGGLYFSNQLAPYIREYKTGDIIFFKYEGKIWFSRIVALGGDIIQIKEKEIIVNGATRNDSVDRVWNGWDHGTFAINKTIKIPDDSVYILSDNLAAQHDDSRVFGPVKKASIVGLMWHGEA
ncbi:TPA: signal peptidase I [Legionella pneumophila]|nr:signal peptidase I [Legionella pneumophila]HAU0695818.1 signal peptidase I [Legionella pneumophila]HAU0874112.1 signal peptidase I [Legionella pneumophila]